MSFLVVQVIRGADMAGRGVLLFCFNLCSVDFSICLSVVVFLALNGLKFKEASGENG